MFIDNSFKIPFFQQKFSEKSKFKRPKKPGQAQQACLQQCLRPVLGLWKTQVFCRKSSSISPVQDENPNRKKWRHNTKTKGRKHKKIHDDKNDMNDKNYMNDINDKMTWMTRITWMIQMTKWHEWQKLL